MHTMDTMSYGHKKYRPPISPTNFYQHDMYSRPTTLRPQSEYRFAGGGYPRSSAGSGRSGGLCSAALVGGALLAALAVLAVAALAFYMGALRPDSGEPFISFEGVLRVTRGDVYGGAPGSPAWKERQRRYTAALQQVYATPSPIKQAFAGVVVTGFGDHKLDVHFRLYLDRRKIPSSMSNLEEALKNILVQDILSKHPAFGQIKIDTSSIMFKRDLEHTYHSESFVKEAMNESLAVINPKVVTPQNVKDKTLQSRVGVVRKTTVKPNQPTKRRDADEPDIDTDNLPVVQGTFQITKTEADITENKQNSNLPKTDEKVSHKPSITTKVITTTRPTTTVTTTKRIQTTTLKPRPFTMKSTLNVKTRTEPTIRKEFEQKSSTTTSATNIPTIVSSTTTLPTTTNNVSQLLYDLLTNENHYKELPKIDSLFTVPHVINTEPWRPITRPYYDTTSAIPPPSFEIPIDQNAEDRIGVAEVVDDVSILESILSPIPPKIREKSTKSPEVLHNMNPNLSEEASIPTPIYTSFKLPSFAPSKNMETLGSIYPKPFPLPVDKISSVVEPIDEIISDDDDDGKPVERPPKDKTTSVSINVMQFDQQDNDTEKISVDGASIIKKQNVSSSIITTTELPYSTPTIHKPVIGAATSTVITDFEKLPIITNKDSDVTNTSKETSTRRPNDKVSVIPSTSTPHHTWELVNTSTNDNETFNKNSPEKHYNDTLQAIITKNDVILPNTTPKFASKISILRNLTDIIKKYTNNYTTTTDKFVQEIPTGEVEERHSHDEIAGSVEVVSDEEIETTTLKVITLLPAKSNLGVNRPLRPRPKIKVKQSQQEDEEQRSFEPTSAEIESIMNNDEIKTFPYNDDFNVQSDTTEPIVLINDNIEKLPETNAEGYHSNNRLPKSSDNLNESDIDNIPASSTNENVSDLPEGIYRVSYHVTGSVSSKQANRTENIPSYELALIPDIVLEIPANQTNTLTIDKLKQLANLATISNVNDTISTKAIPSSYTLNQAGFKILKRIPNKTSPSKTEEKNSDKSSFQKNQYASNKPVNKIVPIIEECNNATSFRCASGACLPVTSRCNKLLDCPDGEDERACSCADYLRAEFSQAKICDGVVDCWDFSDENKCEWCQEGQYVCSNARQCVETSRICDGTPDCPLGDDEKSCVALGDHNIEDNEVIPYNEEGFLMVRKRGVWGRLCVDSFNDVITEANSFLQLPDLGRAVCRAMTFQNSSWSREAREGRASKAGYWEVWHNAAARAADTRLTFRRSTCARRRALRVRCTQLECGIRPHADVQQPRVVGGDGAASGAWPWQAALYRDGDFQCGGTLIHAQWLLSATHCFYQVTEAHWVARLGALRRGAWPRGPWEAAARVRQVVLHPRYEPRGFRNDIALLRVDALRLHARLRPACLPPPRAQPPAGHHCTVVGWGQLYEHERVYPDTLQEVELPVISTAECQRRTRLLQLYRVTEDMFCAGYETGGRDACLGDSGGPLMCQDDSDSKWYVYGVTSNGHGCARANRPGVYTKVSHYIGWIDSVLAKHTAPENRSDSSEENDDFYMDLEAAENRRASRLDTCKGHRCPLGECLPASSVCNGFIECSDSSDEWQCNKAPFNNSSLNPD